MGGPIDEKTKSMEKMTGFLNMYWDSKAGKLWIAVSYTHLTLPTKA